MAPIDENVYYQIRHDLESHASTLGRLVDWRTEDQKWFNKFDTWIAVRIERDEQVDERFNRLEKRLDSIASLGRWILGALGSSLVTAVVAFVVSGGIHVG